MRKRFYFLNQAPLGIGEWGADRSTHSSPAPSSIIYPLPLFKFTALSIYGFYLVL